jgi:PAS domain S-box-containing protein
VGQHIGFINNPQEFSHFIEDFFENQQTTIAQKTIKINLKGTVHYYLLIAQKYNQGKAAVSVGIDITENKNLEQELHVTFSRLKTLITNLKVGILLKDKRRNVLFVNQAFCDLFDISTPPVELIGKSYSDFKEYYYPIFQDPEVVEERNEKIIADQELVTNEEWTLNNKITVERDYIPIIIDDSQEGSLWVYQDVTERKNYETELENSLQQKEMLLKEIHHRVKNNLLVVSNLLEFQTDYTNDPEVLAVLEESQSRIQSMALIHEKLYRSTGLDKIDFGEYLEALTDNLFESYSVAETRINLEKNIDSIFLNIETANPCGLIVNELVSNAFKHAFPNEKQGTIWLSLSQDNEGQITLVVQDDGVGFPQDLDLDNLESLGLDLVQTLTQQLKGNLHIEQKQGAYFTLTFSERMYRKRYSVK